MNFTTSTGIVLHYKRQGKGEPLVFIHGLASNLQSWNYQFQHFCRSFDTLAYDCRGHGASTIPEVLSMQDHANDAFEICSLFEQPVTVVGISMGGYIVQNLMIQHPEIVKRAVLIATKSHGKGAATSKAADTQEKTDPLEARFRFSREFLYGPDTTDEQIHQYIKLEEQIPPEQFLLVNHAITEFDYRPLLNKFNKPVLIIHGDHDHLIQPEYGKELADIIPNAQFVSIPNGGHAVMIDKPQEVNRAIETFLAETK
ncbi:alpha/beta fold hydrolase [Effusibacillus dendaii]|uniref:Non-heme bromoperoxidase BpoC n=1 Tax=Effusibacillus dendaii TaxID=2743772 RepID=A0A7I8D648_9BACL|nr:alpha/beta hydrolase [Effusibacillus dendaii]BCJ85604.1 non-heme bromoperoxidase BpoC [Effusibacillus dendaii]